MKDDTAREVIAILGYLVLTIVMSWLIMLILSTSVTLFEDGSFVIKGCLPFALCY